MPAPPIDALLDDIALMDNTGDKDDTADIEDIVDIVDTEDTDMVDTEATDDTTAVAAVAPIAAVAASAAGLAGKATTADEADVAAAAATAGSGMACPPPTAAGAAATAAAAAAGWRRRRPPPRLVSLTLTSGVAAWARAVAITRPDDSLGSGAGGGLGASLTCFGFVDALSQPPIPVGTTGTTDAAGTSDDDGAGKSSWCVAGVGVSAGAGVGESVEVDVEAEAEAEAEAEVDLAGQAGGAADGAGKSSLCDVATVRVADAEVDRAGQAGGGAARSAAAAATLPITPLPPPLLVTTREGWEVCAAMPHAPREGTAPDAVDEADPPAPPPSVLRGCSRPPLPPVLLAAARTIGVDPALSRARVASASLAKVIIACAVPAMLMPPPPPSPHTLRPPMGSFPSPCPFAMEILTMRPYCPKCRRSVDSLAASMSIPLTYTTDRWRRN